MGSTDLADLQAVLHFPCKTMHRRIFIRRLETCRTKLRRSDPHGWRRIAIDLHSLSASYRSTHVLCSCVLLAVSYPNKLTSVA
jgi:hypothetical protein